MSDVNYTRINWEDTPSTATPINAENLNKMDKGISDCVTEVNSLKSSFSQALTDLRNTSIAQAVGAVASDTFAQIVTKLGNIVNRGAVSQSITATTSTQTYTVPAGYHNGSGVVTVSPQQHSGTYSVTSNGTKDMGASHNYRYVSVSVLDTLKFSYFRTYGCGGTVNYLVPTNSKDELRIKNNSFNRYCTRTSTANAVAFVIQGSSGYYGYALAALSTAALTYTDGYQGSMTTTSFTYNGTTIYYAYLASYMLSSVTYIGCGSVQMAYYGSLSSLQAPIAWLLGAVTP